MESARPAAPGRSGRSAGPPKPRALFSLRFDFRNPAFAGTTTADRYQAALDMATWADRLGCARIVLSEHHCSPDGYLPSPLTMVAAMAARTRDVQFSIAALLAPFYDPLRLAEDMVVLDHLSRGRVELVVGAGYVREEFAMFDVPLNQRGRRVVEVVETLKAAFTGQPFEFRGRTVQITPGPYRPGGPRLVLGGASEAAARRAARIADGFTPALPEVWEYYRDEVQRLGRRDPGPASPLIARNNLTTALATDPDEGWARMGPYFLHENNAYGRWQEQNDAPSPYETVRDVDVLREAGRYRVLTPQEYIAELGAAPFPFASLHPLCGGMPIDLAWSSLRLFEREVLPAFE
ncbi:Flavin-dependent oxidoreductase, luciferase family (includes alkanesulfonate monooxygenase SsuD and methylene tetrahydromethanopterin reductase) [Parafrankia irregularis]|uniref:Flavin-dependent oxidoreductase, luciferase family (Includes alkanesulfonate monooxygenase SsuD and methylene tetrahydromethanopterin reductase) n=2 Tax=Frankiaceae TaxID=74712 RepID=A0A0S4QUR2_9ACTN|nr:LLM class flavin-dependent oxidoreductase [Parafrankia sp. CH37]CUU59261.1 Flavin-dependent oxidoreductase, luciferase family (includes alkanesulfonate monooxygenase SsuD and methylene tetrahydromethanopterin reductase) [Parafrankia irregularis]